MTSNLCLDFLGDYILKLMEKKNCNSVHVMWHMIIKFDYLLDNRKVNIYTCNIREIKQNKISRLKIKLDFSSYALTFFPKE